MDVVVIAGSMKVDGITNQITKYILDKCNVNYKFYYANKINVANCIACDYCFSNANECIIKDDLQLLMDDISDAKLVILASPLHFSTYSAPLLQVISRFQYLFALKYHHRLPSTINKKCGLAILSAGNDYAGMFDGVLLVDKLVFDHLNVSETNRLEIRSTDHKSVEELVEINQVNINCTINFIKERIV